MKTLLISGQTLGRGDDALGAILIEKFFTLLADDPAPPEAVFFYNTGVRLCVEGSPVIPYLKALRGRGVNLMACGTCLEFFKVRPVPEVEAATMKHLLALMRDDPAVVTV
jgi:intracellular sulfur oxidation DsrE/DsrF family protein